VSHEQGKLRTDIKHMKIWIDGDRHETRITALASEAIRFTERADDFHWAPERVPPLGASKVTSLGCEWSSVITGVF
jgi:hypothetical protein